MANITSPLRYPGGKSSLTNFLTSVLEKNRLQGCTYVEPFCGGAGAALNLLLSNKVTRLILNDADFSIYAFWQAILTYTDSFAQLIRDTPITIDEWHKQKNIYGASQDILEQGFATFFLNRCNISGILKANPIGGLQQTGKWLIDARFNKINLIKRIETIAAQKHRITIVGKDVFDFLKEIIPSIEGKKLIYFDPPYYNHGPKLYLNSFNDEQHARLASILRDTKDTHWLMTYDDAEQIRLSYTYCTIEPFTLNHFAHKAKKGTELLIYPQTLAMPAPPQPYYGLPSIGR